MRKVTVCKLKEIRKPGKKDGWYEHPVYRMQPGTAWRIDTYGQHEVVEVSEEICKKTEGWCSMWFDGRNMIVFDTGDDKRYAQPMTDDSRATEDRLGKKRKLRKRKERVPRREAPGVAPVAPASDEEPPRKAIKQREEAPRKPRGLLKRVLSLRI